MKIKKVLASGMVLAQLGSLGVGLATVSAAEETIPAYKDTYKSVGKEYQLSFNQFLGTQGAVDINNENPVPGGDGTTTNSPVRGAKFSIKQVEEFTPNGAVVDLTDADAVEFEMKGENNIVTLSEDGTYTITPIHRAWGYKNDIQVGADNSKNPSVYRYSFPVYNDGVASDTQTLGVNLKFEEILGTINGDILKKVGEDGQGLANVQFQLTQLYDAKTGKVGRGIDGLRSETYNTLDDGAVVFENLPEGIYEVRETQSAQSYAIDNSVLLYQVTLNDATNEVVVKQVNRIQANEMLTAQGVEGTIPTIDGVADKEDVMGTFENAFLPDIEKEVRTHTMKESGEAFDNNANLNADFIKLADGIPLSNVDRTIDYKFVLDLPKDINRYDIYTITDQLNADNFDLTSVDIKAVQVFNGSNEVEPSKTYDNGLLTIDFTPEQLKALDGSLDLTVLFSVNLNPNLEVTADTQVDNTVKLTFDNGVGANDEKEKTVTVKPREGNLKVTKVDGQNETKKLKGAEFLLLRRVDDVELAEAAANEQFKNELDGKVAEVTAKLTELGVDKSDDLKLVKATHSNGSEVDTIITGDEGLAKVNKLPLGTYYLVETKAPVVNGEAYRLNKTLSDEIVIHDDLADNEALNLAETSIKNYLQSDRYPATGTWGYYGLVGVAVVAGLGSIVLGRFKEEESEQA